MKGSRLLLGIALLTYALVLCGCSRQASQEATSVTQHHRDAPHVHEQAEAGLKLSPGHHDELSGQMVSGVREITVEAFQYGFKPDPIVVKEGERVRIIAKSTDVKHGLGIEDFSINAELPPGEEKVVELTPDKAGEFHIHCTVYCGSGHGDMHGTLLVLE